MELFKNSKLMVTISDDNTLIVSKKEKGKGSVCCGSTEVSQSSTNLSEVIAMIPYKGGNSVAIALTDGSMNLTMNKTAVTQLIDKWNAIPISFTTELLFEKKKLQCSVTSHGHLLLVSKTKSICSSQKIEALGLPMADIVLVEGLKKWIGKETLFMCTEKHAIEVKSVESGVIERLRTEAINNGAKLPKVKVYRRAFRFTLKRCTEYLYTTDKGVAYYYKDVGHDSVFHFAPWDGINSCIASKGCCKKKLIVLAKDIIITQNKFGATSVNEIVELVNQKISDNAGNGKMFGKGSNRVCVTDTHVICIGKGKLEAHCKPYTDGQLIRKSWFSSYVNISGFEVKVGRNQWKGFCCFKGSFYNAVTAEPSRELITKAEEHRL